MKEIKIPYARQWIDEMDIAAVVEVLQSDFLTTGPNVQQFEESLTKTVGASYAVAFSSGTAALHGAYYAAGIRAGDEVIVPANTFAATANAALYLGAKPVFADIEPDTGNMDAQGLEKMITPRTKAIVPVHFSGLPVDLENIYAIAERHGLMVIEDAAHALGAAYKEKLIGSKGNMTVFSFHPVKHIATGEGGMVTTNDPSLYETLLLFRSHGITRDRHKMKNEHGGWYYEMLDLGFNYRMTDFQSALGSSQLKKLGQFLTRRREIATRYYKELASSAEQIGLPGQRPFRESAWHLFVIRVLAGGDARRKLYDYLHSKGILVNVHYLPVYLHPYYQELGYGAGLCPQAENFYWQALSLPMFYGLTDDDQARVIQELKAGLL